MLALQLGLSFVAWIVVGVTVARRLRRTPVPIGRGSAAVFGGLLFILSAVVLVAGLLWVAQTAGPPKRGLSGSNWLAVTAIGMLFTAGQAHAAALVLGSVAHGSRVTDEPGEPSSSSSPTRPERIL